MKQDVLLVAIVAVVAILGITSLSFTGNPASSAPVTVPEQSQEIVLDDPALARWSEKISDQQEIQPEDIEELVVILERINNPQAQMVAMQMKEDIRQSKNLYGFAVDGSLSFVPDEITFEDDRLWYDGGSRSYGFGKIGRGYGVSVRFKF